MTDKRKSRRVQRRAPRTCSTCGHVGQDDVCATCNRNPSLGDQWDSVRRRPLRGLALTAKIAIFVARSNAPAHPRAVASRGEVGCSALNGGER